MKPLDPRLLRHSAAARGYLAVTVVLGLAATALILLQASLLAHLLAAAATGTGTAALAGSLAALGAVLLARAAAGYGGEVTALRAAAAVKSQLRRRLTDHVLELGPSWLTGHRSGEVTTLATRGLDALDPYFARYLPQLVLACVVPFAVLIRVGLADWLSGVVIGVTLPLIPLFAILVGLHTKAVTQRQWRLLARLGGHFLDVVEGLPTLKLFGRAKPQAEVIGRVTGEYRKATMATLRVAFLSAFVLELAAALATALVAVEVGLRLLAGHMSYQTALLVLLLTPEAYLPLRAVGAQFHASTEGAAAAADVFAILDTPVPGRVARLSGSASGPVDLRIEPIRLSGVGLSYPGRGRDALAGIGLTIRPGDQITLTGPSGAGKSSLLALLLRFAEPTSGRIEVGDRTWPGSRWGSGAARSPGYRRTRTCSPRRSRRTSRSATRPPAARPVAAAARAAGADGFIEDLPQGYDTAVGEGGQPLSSGQRQQLALARAFLRDAPLLLLDEPAAHLDADTADRLDAALTALAAGRTVIRVAHDRQPPPHATATHATATRTFALDHGRLSQMPRIPGSSPARVAAPVAS